MNLTFPLHSAFLALPVEGEAKWQFQALQERLKEFEDSLRFQNPDSPHLTLQFWSQVMEIEFDPIIKQAEKIAAAQSAFTIKVTGAETFGSRGEDRVLFLTVAFSEELARLKKSCPWSNPRHPERSPKGAVEGRSTFHPHITLARIRHPQRFVVVKKKLMKKLEDCSFEIPFDRLQLYGEVEGVKQTPIQGFVFG